MIFFLWDLAFGFVLTICIWFCVGLMFVLEMMVCVKWAESKSDTDSRAVGYTASYRVGSLASSEKQVTRFPTIDLRL